MKKLIALILGLLFLSILFAEPFWEDFSGTTFPPDGWTVGPTPWYRETDPNFCYSLPGAARTGHVWDTTYWLITPRLYPTPGANILTFWRRDHEAGYIWDYHDEYTYVMVSTLTNNYLHFNTVLWTGAWDDFGLAWQQTQIDLSAYNGQSIYIAFKHVSTGGNFRYIDDVSGVNLAVIPPDNPASFTATPIANTQIQLTWEHNSAGNNVMVAYNTEDSFGTPLDNQVYEPGDLIPGGGTILCNTEATDYLHTGLNPSQGYYYRAWSVQEIAGEIIYSLGTGALALTPGPASNFPWEESFEAGNTDATPVVGWTQQSISGSAAWRANRTATANFRAPRSGFWNAYLSSGNNDWMFKELLLDANTLYTVRLWARQDGYNINNAGITICYGSAANANAMPNVIVPLTTIQRQYYQELSGTFSPPASGTYYLGIRAYVNSPTNYLSMDDISIFTETIPGMPSLSILPGTTSDTILLDWAPVDGATWYAVYMADDPFTSFGPGITEPAHVTEAFELEIPTTGSDKKFYKVTAGTGTQP